MVLYCCSHTCHEAVEERYIMIGCERVGEELVCFKQVIEVCAGEVCADVAAAVFV